MICFLNGVILPVCMRNGGREEEGGDGDLGISWAGTSEGPC